MKKILVPCDFSEPAVQAFRFAAQMAAMNKGEIFLLNVVEVPVLHQSMLVPVQSYESAFVKKLREKANKNFQKMNEKWGRDVKVSLLVQQGPVLSTLTKFITRKRIDLVVMGTHGSSGIRERTIGSNTEKMVRASTVPVIAVKKAPDISTLHDIVFPTDLEPGKKKVYTALKVLQKFFRARLHLLYVNTPAHFTADQQIEERLNQFAKQNQFRNYSLDIYSDVDEKNGVIHFSSRFKSKIVAMSTHGRKGLMHWLNGSVAEDVVNHIDCPIWTLAEA